MHRANEVRPILAGLAALAEKYRCAVLCIRHLGKSQQDHAIYRGLGSIDFAAAARSVLLVGEDPTDKTRRRRVLAQSKMSLAAKGASLAFELRQEGFIWCGLSDVTAEALLAPPKTEEEKSALDEAADFLQEALAEGPRPADDVVKEARKAGISEITLKRAKKQLGIQALKDGDLNKNGKRAWRWHLPEGDQGDQKDEDDELPSKGISDDHLDPLTETVVGQGIQANLQDDHMIPLQDDPQSLAAQGFEVRRSRGSFQEPLEEVLQDEDDHLADSREVDEI